jgi:hypothetical protein
MVTICNRGVSDCNEFAMIRVLPDLTTASRLLPDQVAGTARASALAAGRRTLSSAAWADDTLGVDPNTRIMARKLPRLITAVQMDAFSSLCCRGVKVVDRSQ